MIQIKGIVWREGIALTEQEFSEQFIDFCELKGWLFTGVTKDDDDLVNYQSNRLKSTGKDNV